MDIGEQLAQAQLDGYNSYDIDKFLVNYADDVEVINFPDNTLNYMGKDEMRKRYSKMFNEGKVHAKLANRIVMGNKVMDHEIVTFKDREGTTEVVALYEIENDLIKRVRFIR